jgi:hypothetical protein
VLEYRLDDQVFDLSTLSSGEREVVNVAFDFLLRRPTDCIVFFDEPELHLHPELSHRLIQTLQGIGERNQFVLTTHSPDIIAGSLDKSVVFVSPPEVVDGVPRNQAMQVTEDDETNQALRLLGHSIGIITLGKKIVLIEGTGSSMDKETYGSLIRNRYPGMVLVPSGGKHVIESFDAVHAAVLSRTIWGVEFFMLCDRDSAPVSDLPVERVQVLPRYHLENYFLDESVWASAFSTLEPEGSWLRDPAQIHESLRSIAAGLVSYAAALAVSSSARLRAGNIDLMPKGAHQMGLPDLLRALAEKAESERGRLDEALEATTLVRMAEEYAAELEASLTIDDERWKRDIPGKPLLGMFTAKAQLHASRARKLYLDAAAAADSDPFLDVKAIFDRFASA